MLSYTESTIIYCLIFIEKFYTVLNVCNYIFFFFIKLMYSITMYRLRLPSCSSGFYVVTRSLGGTTDLIILHLGLICFG